MDELKALKDQIKATIANETPSNFEALAILLAPHVGEREDDDGNAIPCDPKTLEFNVNKEFNSIDIWCEDDSFMGWLGICELFPQDNIYDEEDWKPTF
jgi:hypothetical protein